MPKPLTIIALFCTLTVSQSAFGASFDCKNTETTVEKTICADLILSRLDEFLASSYQKQLTTSSLKNVRKESQRNWLITKRNPCKDDVQCLKQEYLYRLLGLQNHGQNSVSGSYERYNQGKPSFHPSDLDILQLNDQEIYVYGVALWIIDAELGILHIGEIDGIYHLTDNRVNYQDNNGCSLTIAFDTDSLIIIDSNDPNGCWGVHVTFNGQYQKTK